MNSRLRFFLHGYISDEETIKEIIQDVFVKLWQNREKLYSEDSLKSYIYQITKNHVIDILRKNKLELVNFDETSENDIISNESIHERIENEELEKIINDGIINLSNKKKEIFLLHRFEKLTYPEISQKLNISVSSVEKNISSALKDIKKLISQEK